MDISSRECFPNLSRRCNEDIKPWWLFFFLYTLCIFGVGFLSPSGVVQVEKKPLVPKFGKNLVVVPVHIACDIKRHKGSAKSC